MKIIETNPETAPEEMPSFNFTFVGRFPVTGVHSQAVYQEGKTLADEGAQGVLKKFFFSAQLPDTDNSMKNYVATHFGPRDHAYSAGDQLTVEVHRIERGPDSSYIGFIYKQHSPLFYETIVSRQEE